MKKLSILLVLTFIVALGFTQPASAGPYATVMTDYSRKCNIEFRYRDTTAGYPQAQVRVNATTPRDDNVNCLLIDGFGVMYCAAANSPCSSASFPSNLDTYYDLLGNPEYGGCPPACGYNLLVDPDTLEYAPGTWYSVTDRNSVNDTAFGMIFTLEVLNYDSGCREEVTWQTWLGDGYSNGHIINYVTPPLQYLPQGCAP